MVELEAFINMILPILYLYIMLSLASASSITINETKPTMLVETVGEGRSATWKYPEEHSLKGHHRGPQYDDNNNYNQPVAGFPDSLRPYPLGQYASSTSGLNGSNTSTRYGEGHYPKSVQNVYYPIYVNDYNQKPNRPGYFNPNPMKNPYPYPYPYPPKINPNYPYQEPNYYPNKGYPFLPNYPPFETYPTKAYPNSYPPVDSFPSKGYPYFPEPSNYPYPQQKPYYYPNYQYNPQNFKIGYGSQFGYVQAMMSPNRGIKIEYIINPLLCYGLGMSSCSGYILKQNKPVLGSSMPSTPTPFKTL